MTLFTPADPFDLVIFGGTGDLAKRKLLPALFHRDTDGQLGEGSRIVASSRKELEREDFIEWVEDALRKYLPAGEIDPETWKRFSARLHHHRQDVTSSAGWSDLEALLSERPEHIRVFYLATLPSLYRPAARNLTAAGLAGETARIVLEKPVGRDFAEVVLHVRAAPFIADPAGDADVTIQFQVGQHLLAAAGEAVHDDVG